MDADRIYLDHNATTPMLPAVREAVAEAWERAWANPMSPHAHGRAAAAALDRAREQVAALVGKEPRDVIFTSGATEANGAVLGGLVDEARPLVIASAVEHPSVRAWSHLEAPVGSDGIVDLDALAALLDEHAGRVAVVTVMAANNETGVMQPTEAVHALCRERGVVYHCDATQLPGKAPFRVSADLVTLSAHKFGGPKGVGAFVGRPRPHRPLLRGGGQERGLRSGTHNVPGIVGMGVAASLAGAEDPAKRDAIEAAARRLGGRVVGEGSPRLPNTSCVVFDVPGDVLAVALDLEGVSVSSGSACESGAATTSAVLKAMGWTGRPVRFSTGPATGEVGPAIAALERVLARARSG